jgi:hypothetical protein
MNTRKVTQAEPVVAGEEEKKEESHRRVFDTSAEAGAQKIHKKRFVADKEKEVENYGVEHVHVEEYTP